MTVPESVNLIQSDNSESKKENAKKKPGGTATARNVFLKFSSLIAAGKMVYQDLFSGNSTDGIHSFRECGFFVLVVL